MILKRLSWKLQPRPRRSAGKSLERIENVNHKEMKENGVTIVGDMPQDLFNKLSEAGKPAVAEWKDKMGPDGEKILAEYTKLRGMYTRLSRGWVVVPGYAGHIPSAFSRGHS